MQPAHHQSAEDALTTFYPSSGKGRVISGPAMHSTPEKNASNPAAGSVPARMLCLAARVAGGEQQLAERLNVAPVQLACWLSSLQTPPRPVLLQAMAIVMEQNSAAVADSRKGR